jgi:hypothetical protein
MSDSRDQAHCTVKQNEDEDTQIDIIISFCKRRLRARRWAVCPPNLSMQVMLCVYIVDSHAYRYNVQWGPLAREYSYVFLPLREGKGPKFQLRWKYAHLYRHFLNQRHGEPLEIGHATRCRIFAKVQH